MKNNAVKNRRLYEGKILAGFAGSGCRRLTLFARFEEKLRETGGNLTRSVIELAKDWAY
jgi:ATP-dependent HslUV protease subunit HslV